jgi:hypothetical protein
MNKTALNQIFHVHFQHKIVLFEHKRTENSFFIRIFAPSFTKLDNINLRNKDGK